MSTACVEIKQFRNGMRQVIRTMVEMLILLFSSTILIIFPCEIVEVLMQLNDKSCEFCCWNVMWDQILRKNAIPMPLANFPAEILTRLKFCEFCCWKVKWDQIFRKKCYTHACPWQKNSCWYTNQKTSYITKKALEKERKCQFLHYDATWKGHTWKHRAYIMIIR